MAGFNNSPGSGAPDIAADFRADMGVLEDEGDGTQTPPPGGKGTPPPAKEDEEDEHVDDENVDDEEGKEDDEEDKEEDEDEHKEDEPEPVTPIRHSRPTVRDITAKYPDFFKAFPDMRHMLFREGEYTKVFPTVDDAKAAAGDAESFSHFKELMSSGKVEDFEQFVGGVKEAGSLNVMAAHFLPALYKTDQAMYFQVTTPIAESLVRNAFAAASQAGNENLKNAALHLAQWAFGDVQYASGEKRSEGIKIEAPKGDERFETEKKQFYQDRYNDAQSHVQTNSRQRLVADITKGLDPNNVFTPTVRNLLIKEILSEIGNTLEADENHMRQMNSMWKNASKAGFAGDWKDRLLSTYLSRAKAHMPAIRQRIRDGALATEQHKAEDTGRRADRSASRRDVQGSQNSGSRGNNSPGRPPAAGNIDWSKTSDLDVLNDRVTLKKA